MQTVAPIEFIVLDGINDVEADQPTNDRASETCPAGKCRVAVRGLALSNFRSTIRLKAMAQVRAETIAPRIRPTIFSPGQPCSSRAATTIAASANGRAKTV